MAAVNKVWRPTRRKPADMADSLTKNADNMNELFVNKKVN